MHIVSQATCIGRITDVYSQSGYMYRKISDAYSQSDYMYRKDN